MNIDLLDFILSAIDECDVDYDPFVLHMQLFLQCRNVYDKLTKDYGQYQNVMMKGNDIIQILLFFSTCE